MINKADPTRLDKFMRTLVEKVWFTTVVEARGQRFVYAFVDDKSDRWSNSQ